MAKLINSLPISATVSIAWTAGETKTSEKKTSSFKLAGGVPLAPRDAYLLEVVRPAGNTPDALTTYIYNVSEVESGNERDGLLASVVTETASGGGVVQRCYPIRGLFLGSSDNIKLGAKFSANQTGIALTAYYRIIRSTMA